MTARICALEGCADPVSAAATYCSGSHRAMASRRRKMAAALAAQRARHEALQAARQAARQAELDALAAHLAKAGKVTLRLTFRDGPLAGLWVDVAHVEGAPLPEVEGYVPACHKGLTADYRQVFRSRRRLAHGEGVDNGRPL